MGPISLKRSTPSHSDDEIDEPTSKRRRVEPALPQTPPPEDVVSVNITKTLLFDEEPRELLIRTIALALEYVGFEGATEEALESFCAEVETYAAHLLSKITSSMLNARRSQPTPIDFQYGLSSFNLPLASIEPHLKPPISSSKIRLEIEDAPPEDRSTESLAALLGDDLSGEPDKNGRPYIPKRFPSFPSKHTYKWTEKESARVTDPRKIREEAAKAARQGEEALRRLVKVGKLGKEKDVKKAASKDPRSKERHELWEKAMADLMTGKPHSVNGNAGQGDDRSMIVNAEKQYWRKGVPAKKKAPAPADIEIES